MTAPESCGSNSNEDRHRELIRLEASRVNVTFEPHHEKTCFMPYANNKDADQPVHPCSLISTFVVHCLDSII